MKAGEEFFLDIITKNIQFKIPIYQRLYDWRIEHCQTLIEDIYQLLRNPEIPLHFMGSIVYIDENDQTRVNPTKELLLIDGQQRITTFTLLFLILEEIAKDQDNDELAEQIRESYLINKHTKLENKGKLVLTQTDNNVLEMLLNGENATEVDSNLVTNYNYLKDRIMEMNNDFLLQDIHDILYKVMVVDIGLLKGTDNPQQIFESLNATGKALTNADLIRNFILMNLESEKQNFIYTKYWYPMENLLEDHLEFFLTNFVYMKKGISTNIKDLYKEFKLLFYKNCNNEDDVEKFASELKKYAEYYANTEFEEEKNEKINSALRDLNRLGYDTYIPFLLNVYNEYNEGNMDTNDLCEIIRTIESFLFRRSICEIPTNSLNPIFRTMWKNITKAEEIDISEQCSPLNLKDSFIKELKSGEWNKRWPDDNEFRENLIYNNLYGKRFTKLLLEELERFSSKESQNRSFDNFSIEHILPQTSGDPEKLSNEWKEMLGSDYLEIREKWLHKLGNLTLTCYNPALSDKSFEYKTHMEDGYADSPLKLNLQIAKYENWNEDAIIDRSNKLAELSIKRWKYDSRDFEKDEDTCYFITPLSDRKSADGEILKASEIIQDLIENQELYVFTDKIYKKTSIKEGDNICFYEAGKGIVSHAKVSSDPEWIAENGDYPWEFELKDINVYLNNPNPITSEIKNKLDEFKNKSEKYNVGLFVRTTQKITKHDFDILTQNSIINEKEITLTDFNKPLEV
ncbi:DUF262 domain-containing protein [Methanobacterium sp. ACI-7]|uniref:DUF262 domain-containing protein n=1 Tax=unclassified Methanobacterium TaxID=2627676 RepID=UPI0039C46AC9